MVLRVRVELTSEVFQTPAVTTLATSANVKSNEIIQCYIGQSRPPNRRISDPRREAPNRSPTSVIESVGLQTTDSRLSCASAWDRTKDIYFIRVALYR